MTAVLVTLLAVVVALLVLVALELRRAETAVVDEVFVEMSRPAVLVFLTTTCTTCGGFWSVLGDRARELPQMELVVVTKGAEAEDRRRVRRLAPSGVRVLMSTETWERYSVSAAPYVVAVDRRGAPVARASVSSWSDVVATGTGAQVS